jgi:hypothetical protein
MTLKTDDVYAPYEAGMRQLLQQLGAEHPRYTEVHSFQQRLTDNIKKSRSYGDTEARRAERSDIIFALDRLSRDELHIPFSNICNLATPQHPQPTDWSPTDAETALRDKVADSHLRASLNAIRYAVEYIWTTPPRYVPYHSNHGADHYKRLIAFANHLLAANDGRPFSPHEIYLLLAGIYLHDIGIQCNLFALPAVRERAEKMGATFGDTFTPAARPRPTNASGTSTASTYTIEQQKAILKHHHYLSAAWIDHASHTGETDLGPAAMTIPRDLVEDLLDICKHHIRQPIKDCPLNFRFDPNGRKQLIAAMLRFIHELDLEERHNPFKRIQDYSFDAQSDVFWWFHQRARLHIVATNMVRLTLALHPDDQHHYGHHVYNAFINEFHSRNATTLSILAQNGIPMHIDPASGLRSNPQEEPLPRDVVQALQTTCDQRSPLAELADEVRLWLRAIRYDVQELHQHDERTIDMRATIDLGPIKQRVLVRCIGGPVKPSDCDALDAALDRRTPQGWLISDRRVSELTRRGDSNDDWISVCTLAEFLQQHVWGPYFDALMAMVERERIPRLYGDMRCTHTASPPTPGALPRPEPIASLDCYVDEWLPARDSPALALLGASGTGKTWFCRHYAHRQLHRYLKDPAHERLPLLITLRDFTRATSVQQLINDALLEHYHLPFIGSAVAIFEEINRRGKLLLLLDGLDDMGRQTDYQAMGENFWTLASLIHPNSKLILTSSAERFSCPRQDEIRPATSSNRPIAPPDFTLLHLEPCSDEQIHQLLTRRLGPEDGAVMADHILSKPTLAEMARKPVLLDLLLAALEEVRSAALTSPAHVYLYATNRLLLRSIETHHTFTTTADKLFFLGELAWEMVRTGTLRLHYTDIPRRIQAFFADRITNQHELDTWDKDLRFQTLLQRNAAGYYAFTHKSLAEYFVAFKFAAEVGCLAPPFATAYCDTSEQPCTIPFQQQSLPALVHTFGAVPLSSGSGPLPVAPETVACSLVAIGQLFTDIVRAHGVSGAGDRVARRAWELLAATRGKSPEQVGYVGGNAANMVRDCGESFVGANLAGTVLSGAVLVGTDLRGATLRGASLRRAVFRNCAMDDVDLRGADLSNEIRPATCRGMQIGGAHGLEQLVTVREGDCESTKTLLELFAEGGALLDEEQQRRLAALQARRGGETPGS